VYVAATPGDSLRRTHQNFRYCEVLGKEKAIMLERISYRGWDNAYRLFNGVVELVVTADVGPRILFYGFRNGENLLHEVKEDAGKTGGSEFCPQAVATIKASGPTRTLPTLAGYSARPISSCGILRIPKADFKSRWGASYNSAGWGAYFREGYLFIKRAAVISGAQYPDFGCNFEVFTNPDFIELETLGPLVELPPGEVVEHVERWWLFAGRAGWRERCLD
jgi:hypothetical protein